MKVGDLVKFMSRVVLILELGEEWAVGLELGETEPSKYRIKYLGKLLT